MRLFTRLLSVKFLTSGIACFLLMAGNSLTAVELKVVSGDQTFPLQLNEENKVEVRTAEGSRLLTRSDAFILEGWTPEHRQMAIPLPIVLLEGGPSGRPGDVDAPKQAELYRSLRNELRTWLMDEKVRPHISENLALRVMVLGWLDQDQFVIHHLVSLNELSSYSPLSGYSMTIDHSALAGHPALLIFDLQSQSLIDPFAGAAHPPLYTALLANDLAAVQAALAAGANPAEPTSFGWTPLHLAAGNNSPASLEVLRQTEARRYRRLGGSWNPLHVAVARGNTEAIHLLIDKEVDLNAVDRASRTPLALAVIHGDASLVQGLLDAGAKPRTSKGTDAALFAVNGFKDDLLPMLLAAGPAPRLLPAQARFSFVQAIEWDRLEVAKLMMQIGKPKLREPFDGKPLALIASQKASVDLMEFLLEAGMPLNVVSPEGNHPIHAAAFSNAAIIPWLVEKGQNPNQLGPEGRTPIVGAVAAGNIEAVEALLKVGADPNSTFNNIHVIEIAASLARREVISLLHANGSRCEFDETHAITAAENALRYDIPEIFAMTLDSCLSVDFSFPGGFPGWGVAERYQAKEIQQLMVDRGLPTEKMQSLTLARPSQLTKALEPLELSTPPYSYSLMQKYGEQRVVVNIIIDAEGMARFPMIPNNPVPELKDPLLYLTQFWKFAPPELPEGTMGVSVNVPFIFKFDSPIFELGSLSTPPKPILQTQPTYPRGRNGNLHAGDVVVEFVINDKGLVEPESPRIVSTFHPDFSEAAMDAIRKWNFEPGLINDKPVNARVRQRISFGTR